jgi:hypothetical protein
MEGTDFVKQQSSYLGARSCCSRKLKLHSPSLLETKRFNAKYLSVVVRDLQVVDPRDACLGKQSQRHKVTQHMYSSELQQQIKSSPFLHRSLDPKSASVSRLRLFKTLLEHKSKLLLSMRFLSLPTCLSPNPQPWLQQQQCSALPSPK